jgi:hypothetical protein
VDSLARQLPEAEHAAISDVMYQLISSSFEIYVRSATAAQTSLYPAIGLTDCVTMASADEVLVITDDFELANRISHLGQDALNINHIRNLEN